MRYAFGVFACLKHHSRNLLWPALSIWPLISLVVATPTIAKGDTMVLGFAGGMGSLGNDDGRGTAVDTTGNVYVTGGFEGTVDFDPGPGVVNLTSAGARDIFVCKFDAAGSLVWARAMGGSNVDVGHAIAVNAAGEVWLTGAFRDSADFDPGPGVYNLTGQGTYEIFVCKLDATGNFVWAGGMGGNNGVEVGFDIAIDDAGNVYSTGFYNGTADFDPGPGVFTVASLGDYDIYVSKLDTNGNFVWAVGVGSWRADISHGIALDTAGDVYITGLFTETVDFDPGPGTASRTTNGLDDIFVCKFDASGAYQWVYTAGDWLTDEGSSVTADTMGNIYVTGSFKETVDFDPGPGTAELTSAGDGDIFLCKLDATGSLIWAKSIGGGFLDSGNGITTDTVGNIYVTGNYRGPVDFDPGPGVFSLSSVAIDDVFVCKFDSAGELGWAGSVGGTGDEDGRDITVDNTGAVYTTGRFWYTADMDPGPGTAPLVSANVADAFILRLEPQWIPVANADHGETDADLILSVLISPPDTSLLTNDTDMNTRAELAISDFDAESTLGATVLVNSDGTFLYDPTGVPAFQTLPEGTTIDDTFTYTLSDGIDTSIGVVTITVRGKDIGLSLSRGWTLMILIILLTALGVLLNRRIVDRECNYQPASTIGK